MSYVKNKPLWVRSISCLGLSSALISVAAPTSVLANAVLADCTLSDGVMVGECQHSNRGTVVVMPVQANVEDDAIPALNAHGFGIRVDGDPVSRDGRILKGTQRQQDRALAAADVAVKFDGLDIRPRLDVTTVETQTVYQAGDAITFRNAMNYPAFVRRGELRIIDKASPYGERTVAVFGLDPNASVTGTVPEGEGLVYVYRVYDDKGRYDETAPASLNAASRRGMPVDEAVEEGTDSTAVRRIPVFGGAVTVSGVNLDPAAQVNTLGETIRPDANGRFVLQRILPTGAHTVRVAVEDGLSLARDIHVPSYDLFYLGLIDITVGKSLNNDLEDATGDDDYDDTFERGRVAFYLKGKIKGKYLLTAAADSGEEELRDLLRNFDDKNPRSLLDRIDPDEYYPVYGDDSTSEIDAPTAGKFYVKLQRDDSHVMWGNYQSEITGTEYLRNERTLYGAQGVYRSTEQTDEGQARLEVQLNAAQPDTLPQRDVFRGTGGSTYFLKFQDITRGSETLLIEVVNRTTGQVLERRTLVYGVDYDINYIQGLVLLREPLSANAASSDLIVSNPNGDNQAFLVANYDHTPTVGDSDSFSYGARAQAWVSDDVRVGVTGSNENLGTFDQSAQGVDVLYQRSEQTYLEVEFAETEGTGLGQDGSLDGGLTLNTAAGVSGKGRAVRSKGQVELKALGVESDGVLGGYYEDRKAGFSTLNYRTANDEELWGLHVEQSPSERVKLRAEYDDYRDSTGRVLREGNASLAYQSSDAMTWETGVEVTDQNTLGDPERSGERVDAGVRLTYQLNADNAVYGYGQGTLKQSGGLVRNNRVGVGAQVKLAEQWRASGEVSDGSTGIGARALINYDRDENNSHYFGYALDPDREFGGVDLAGRDKGSFVVGARRKLNDRLTVYGENTYDLFGVHQSLTSNYGADYALDEYWTITGGLEVGRVTDPRATVASDFKRRAASLGSTYRDEALTVRSRVEYRQDKGVISGSDRNADTVAAELTARYKLDEEARLLLRLEGVSSVNASASIPDAKFVQGTLGYAFRPIDNDRLNVLSKYTYLYDMTERVAATPASGANFLETPRQRAHVLNLDASYDLDRRWTLGAKLGGRWSEQDTGLGFVSNNATLSALNLRYHIVHEWDALVEARRLLAQDLGSDTGWLAAIYRHVGNNFKVGVGYNFGRFSDDLTDVTYDDEGVFINAVGKF